MRAVRTNLIDNPNTRMIHRPGMCTLCNRELVRQGAAEPAFDLASTASALGYWLNDRRRRGVPEHGYPI